MGSGATPLGAAVVHSDWGGLDVCIGVHLSVELQTDLPVCGRSHLSQPGLPVTGESCHAAQRGSSSQLGKSFSVRCGLQLGFAPV